MEYSKILKQSWSVVWRYRALWIFGALLALTTFNGSFWSYTWGSEERRSGVAVKITPDYTIYLPGEGLAIDLTTPGKPYISIGSGEEGEFWRWITGQGPLTLPGELWALLITIGIMLVVTLIVGLLLRYTSEAALIGMVNAGEESGEMLSLRQGFRLGWSRKAWRLFLIDLAAKVPLALVLTLLFLLALSPLLLWSSGTVVAGILGTVLTVGLLFFFALLTFVVTLALSILLPVFRRAGIVEDLGVGKSIARGLSLAKAHPGKVLVIWLIEIGIRLAWAILIIPVIIVIFPVILLFIVAGVVVAGLPAILAGTLFDIFYGGAIPWIFGVIVALPVFILIVSIPILFFSGLVEVLKSSFWTLSYRELRRLGEKAPQPVPGPDARDVEATGAA